MSDNSKIFDRSLLRLRRNRAAGGWAQHDFLKREAARRLEECLADINRDFPLALDLGSHGGEVPEILGERGKVKRWISADMTERFYPHVVCDEELLPFADNSLDLITSALSLHHVNDLPGTLVQIKRALKPDGLFLAILPGASSLKELRTAIVQASTEQDFPLSPRISPFVEIRDAGALLMRAGFALPVADSDMVTVHYDDAFKLMQELRGMGESNVLLEQRRNFTPRSHMNAMVDAYLRSSDLADGAVSATFEFITMTGWKP